MFIYYIGYALIKDPKYVKIKVAATDMRYFVRRSSPVVSFKRKTLA